MSTPSLKFKGSRWLRQRIVLSTLSGTPIKVEDIRAMDEKPGLADCEVSFLKMVDAISNGCRFEINETGTTLKYSPGFLIGGTQIVHNCGTERAVGYFLEGLVLLAPFGKKPISIVLKGIVNDTLDLSPDIFRVVTLPVLKHFGIEEGVELQIKKRGAAPLGGGEVIFKCPVIPQLKAINLVDPGKVKRVRGIAYTTKVTPVLSNRVVTSARNLLNNYIPDVWIYTDHYKGPSAGLSPGYALSLVAESTNGRLLSAESVADKQRTPEELGELVSKLLCDQIAQSGCVDSAHQSMMFLFMALCPEDVSHLRIGKMVPAAVAMLKHLKKFFGVVFRIEPQEDESILVSCRGAGYKNYARKAQ